MPMLKIGALAQRTDTSVETIRFYEREGLLPEPARTDSNYRAYTDSHVQRLSFIRHCRSLDMTLDEIRTLLRFKDAPEDDCDAVNQLLDAHIGHVAQRIRELKSLKSQLQELRARCLHSQEAQHCGILAGLSLPDDETAKRPLLTEGHVHGAHGGPHRAAARG